ncbi:MAG: aldo/keto reductase [Treponema sp.]|jgi:predicted aldo/keto reductase-like oxidoreductase|nr:aldo/keto reductase [Treponema sp.]
MIMLYRDYGKLGFQVSAFGMGCMRLPRIVSGDTAEVDREKSYEMIRYAVDQGVTYFDTAYGYHNMTSEEVLGEALEGGRREKVRIVTKQPFGVMTDLKTGGGKTILENARRNLEATLKKLRTSYIDVYLIHNIGLSTWEEIKNQKIIEEYEKFRAEGLIRGIGFSYHGKYPCFREVLDFYDWGMCQIQQNLIDVDNEATEEGIRHAGRKGCALVIMEPIRGGNLATPPEPVKAIYDEYPVKRSPVEWAFRHILNYPEVSTVLSGVSTMEQLKEDIEIFSRPDTVPGCLNEEERTIISRVREKYKSLASIPCTGCEYCLPCPQGVNIPQVFSKYNDGVMFGTFEPARRGYMFQTRFNQDASHCIECKVCETKCPQHIEIAGELKAAHEKLKGWVE